jgi:hypothetical protein
MQPELSVGRRRPFNMLIMAACTGDCLYSAFVARPFLPMYREATQICLKSRCLSLAALLVADLHSMHAFRSSCVPWGEGGQESERSSKQHSLFGSKTTTIRTHMHAPPQATQPTTTTCLSSFLACMLACCRSPYCSILWILLPPPPRPLALVSSFLRAKVQQECRRQKKRINMAEFLAFLVRCQKRVVSARVHESYPKWTVMAHDLIMLYAT